MNHHQPDPYTLMASLPEGQLQDVLMQLALAHPADFEAAVKHAQILEQAAASRGNPYGSHVEAKHGRFSAASAAEVAECDASWGDAAPSQRCVLATGHAPGHLDVDGHEWLSVPALTAVADAGRLAGHMPKGAQ